ncbi:hypothetical protein ANN_14871 [Periplaneta americana]|uniref:Uncharacterized protein n=1 Tax=Periplaneta americana TaxID=6978 RepID=A0ABQ8SZ33_PERAM|nr:hypothetical protein ANN_14871 [Periplaneta americana]
MMAADGDCHHLCKLMAPVRHRWSINDVIGGIRNTVIPSDCSPHDGAPPQFNEDFHNYLDDNFLVSGSEGEALSYNLREVHGLAINGSSRRIDIIAFQENSSKDYILDPTVRFEHHKGQPEEVNNEKRSIYELRWITIKSNTS